MFKGTIHTAKETTMKFDKWLSSLPTEYQFALTACIIMQVCYLLTPWSTVLDKNLNSILTALGSLALGAIAHGAVVRGKGNAQDLIGTVHPIAAPPAPPTDEEEDVKDIPTHPKG
jgi:hypothetical protein